MLQLTDASQLFVKFILAAFAAVVFVGLLTGGISTRSLLYGERKGGGRYFSPGRVQLLIVTILVAFDYLVNVLQSPDRESLPDVNASVLALLVGSHAIYLGGKARALLFGAIRKEQ